MIYKLDIGRRKRIDFDQWLVFRTWIDQAQNLSGTFIIVV